MFECHAEASTMKRPSPSRGCCVTGGKNATEVSHYSPTFTSGYEGTLISDNFEKIADILRKKNYQIPETNYNVRRTVPSSATTPPFVKAKSITQRHGTEDSSNRTVVVLESYKTGGHKMSY